MNREELLDKVNDTQVLDKQKLIAWIKCLPNTGMKVTPSSVLVGDVYMHPIFQHPYVLLKKDKDHWICAMITSEANCVEILEPCQSRFYSHGFFTKILFTVKEPIGSFMSVYENKTHLKRVHDSLKEMLS